MERAIVYPTLCYPGLGPSPGNNLRVIAGATAVQSASLPPLTTIPNNTSQWK